MGHLIIEANQCYYKEHDGQLKGQLINGINEELMTAEIIRVNHDTEYK